MLTTSQSFGDLMNDSLKKRVNDFCSMEFNGDDGKRVLFFSAKIREKNAVDFVQDPVDLVDSYKIISLTIEGNSAKAVVEYGLIAEFQNVAYHNYPGEKPEPGVVLDLADKLAIRRNPKFHQELIWRFNVADRECILSARNCQKCPRQHYWNGCGRTYNGQRIPLVRIPRSPFHP